MTTLTDIARPATADTLARLSSLGTRADTLTLIWGPDDTEITVTGVRYTLAWDLVVITPADGEPIEVDRLEVSSIEAARKEES